MVTYKIYDENDRYYDSFNNYKDAFEMAREISNDLKRDIVIKKITEEFLNWIFPDVEEDIE